MSEDTNDVLSGMKAISEFCLSIGLPSSPATITDYKNNYGMPVSNLGKSGTLLSSKKAIRKWANEYVNNGPTLKSATDEQIMEEVRFRKLDFILFKKETVAKKLKKFPDKGTP
jgi:hypothetical protein